MVGHLNAVTAGCDAGEGEASTLNQAGDAETTATRARLLMVSHYFDAHRGGVEIVAARLAQELGGAFDLRWLATGDASSPSAARCEQLAATNILERVAALPYPLLAPSALRRIFRAARKSDIILVHDAIYMTSVAAFVAARAYAGVGLFWISYWKIGLAFANLSASGALPGADAIGGARFFSSASRACSSTMSGSRSR